MTRDLSRVYFLKTHFLEQFVRQFSRARGTHRQLPNRPTPVVFVRGKHKVFYGVLDGENALFSQVLENNSFVHLHCKMQCKCALNNAPSSVLAFGRHLSDFGAFCIGLLIRKPDCFAGNMPLNNPEMCWRFLFIL